MERMQIIDCPRDAMQGLKEFIPTERKLGYLNTLLDVGFDVLDCGSFVSPKAIPQMADTHEIIPQLIDSDTDLSVIVANQRGAEDACKYSNIRFLGYPFSISETFQQRNTNASLDESVDRVKAIADLCAQNDKELLIYISMAFGNPYGDDWNTEIAQHWVGELSKLNVKYFSLADTVGVADPKSIEYLFSALIPAFPEILFSAHFHTRPDNWEEKVDAAWKAGCRRFEGAIKGFGGCPMAKDELVGNMATENLIAYCEKYKISHQLDADKFSEAMTLAQTVFPI